MSNELLVTLKNKKAKWHFARKHLKESDQLYNKFCTDETMVNLYQKDIK